MLTCGGGFSIKLYTFVCFLKRFITFPFFKSVVSRWYPISTPKLKMSLIRTKTTNWLTCYPCLLVKGPGYKVIVNLTGNFCKGLCPVDVGDRKDWFDRLWVRGHYSLLNTDGSVCFASIVVWDVKSGLVYSGSRVRAVDGTTHTAGLTLGALRRCRRSGLGTTGTGWLI